MITFTRKTARSFACAISGFCWFASHERHAGLHLSAALAVVIAGVVLRINRVEWCLVLCCVGGVIAAEMLNTAVERLCDRVTQNREEDIRRIKDVSAGAVLVVSLAAAGVGLCVFGPRIWALLPG
jgi:diacylglycerol kinase (ATP)